MSEALEKLRSGVVKRNTLCVCGEQVEVALVVSIRERGAAQKQLSGRSVQFCAACAIERMEAATS